jgi:hypothetical protein
MSRKSPQANFPLLLLEYSEEKPEGKSEDEGKE